MPIDMRNWQIGYGLGTDSARLSTHNQQIDQELALRQAQQQLAREAQTFNQGMATDANTRAIEDQAFQRAMQPSLQSSAEAAAMQRWLQYNQQQEMGPQQLQHAQLQNQRGQLDLQRGQLDFDQERAGMAAVGGLADAQGYGASFDPETGQQTGPASPGALSATDPRTGLNLLEQWHRGADPLQSRSAALRANDTLAAEEVNRAIQHFFAGGKQMSPEDMTAAMDQIQQRADARRMAIIGGPHLAQVLNKAGPMLGQQQITPELIAGLQSTDPTVAAQAEAQYMNLTGRGVPAHMKGMNPQAVQALVDKHPAVRSAKRRLDSAQRLLENAEKSDVPDDERIAKLLTQVDQAEQAYEQAQKKAGEEFGRQAQKPAAAKDAPKPAAGKSAKPVSDNEAEALRYEAIAAYGQEGAKRKYPGLFK